MKEIKSINSTPIIIQSLEDLDKIRIGLHNKQYLKFNCKRCNAEVLRRYCRMKENIYPMMCKSCSSIIHQQSFTEEEKKEIIRKRIQTNIERYGVDNAAKASTAKEKRKQTTVVKREKKKVEKQITKKLKVKVKSAQMYQCGNLTFNSKQLLAIWLWANDLGKDIKKEPIISKYDHDRDPQYYFPDFELDGALIKIKDVNNVEEVPNTVVQWGEEEIQPIIAYLENKYGEGYLDAFKKVV